MVFIVIIFVKVGIDIGPNNDIYVADYFNNAFKVLKAESSYTTTSTYNFGLSVLYPFGVAVDSNNIVYFAMYGGVVAVNNHTVLWSSSYFTFAVGIALDSAMDIYVTQSGGTSVIKYWIFNIN